MSVMPTTNATTGQRGEDAAVAYLRSQKFQIRERNVRFGRLEIDIVTYDPTERMVVFVEVKTRSRSDARYPIRTAVDQRKRRAMRRAIFRWVALHRYEGPARIDVVCVAGDKIVDHIVNIGAEFF